MKTGSKAWKQFMAKLYGIGASVVIVGAMFKIMHWPGAGPMLVAGLSTEAIIFLFSAFEPIHEDPNWELVYPELAMGKDEIDHDNLPVGRGRGASGTGITEKLDELLAEAKIDSELIERLGQGMRALADNVQQIQNTTAVVSATETYTNSLQAAADKVSNLSEAYEKASVAVSGLTSTQEEGQSFGEQMQKLSNNLAALNNVYELQLKGSSAHLEATEKFQAKVLDMMNNLSDSVEDTRLYKENMAMLSKNLTALNTVYGNMLNAMTITK